ncbi:phosphotransferase [Aeromicrobium wangtongii]|uniref:Aminoglycoside phosphotransferase family protein n=1 Tax=Aeromicrobium wangtongii TaxID=2969247 RepID=A0ABY5M6L6_9ACTN|nr:phosphotransferase [Aeromicrobium wangtongii]MCD9199445.1 aminoglycoside phosphotransferase family protein [Aeromicrobium wangtongii]UUP13800.1 aminoglycoside phosphotransferase family protein [Aeromicrobium wangtongii]
MGRPFSERVAHDDWRHTAEQWVRRELANRDIEVVGTIEQPRIRPWSTQLKVPTATGTVWFKANCAHLSFEPLLQAELARLAPDAVEAPCAVDAERGWMLTRDRGTTLGDAVEPTVDDWCRILAGAAALQRIVAGHEVTMLATGLPDCRPSTVVARYDRLLEILSALPEAHPGHVSDDLRSQLVAVCGRVADAAAELDESSLPTTWQHGDLHPWNVFAADGRLFDFGDGQWAHAAEILSVPHAWITRQDTISWPTVLEACADAWDVTPADLASQQRAAAVTQPVNRTLLWWGCLQEATAAEWTQWGDALLQHLTRVLEP